MRSIYIPENINITRDYHVYVCVSGGKDSTATAIALKQNNIPFEMIFADTQWEAKTTYEFLDYLETALGQSITRIKSEGMKNLVFRKKGFPGSNMQFCTDELKKKPMDLYLMDRERENPWHNILVTVGVRREESNKRKDAKFFETDPVSGFDYWRPIADWTVEDVIIAHNEAGIDLNPLYYESSERVGCFPCIHSRKAEIRYIAIKFPERIEEIAKLEEEASQKFGRKVTFFASRQRDKTGMGIREIAEWSKTDRKGLPVLYEDMEPGCSKWGFCEHKW